LKLARRQLAAGKTIDDVLVDLRASGLWFIPCIKLGAGHSDMLGSPETRRLAVQHWPHPAQPRAAMRANEVTRTVASDQSADNADRGLGQPSPAAISFVTTEHFALQGARASTVAESTGRATMFLSAVSGGLVALGLIGTAAGVGRAFYAFGLILLPTLAFVGVVTFDRVLQSGIEDHDYAGRIARLRGYYFQHAPELVAHLLSVPAAERLRIQGLRAGRFQKFVTVAGMVSVITAVLAGSSAGLLAALVSNSNLAAALIAGVLVGAGTLLVLLHVQAAAWRRAARVASALSDDEVET
jgi:hypothetical protein